MNEPINYQMIYQQGRPVFAVVPYREFLQIYPEARHSEDIPHEVVRQMVKHNQSRIRAFREYLGLTQEEVATRMGITQAALSQMEMLGVKLRKASREKLARALGLKAEQLR